MVAHFAVCNAEGEGDGVGNEGEEDELVLEIVRGKRAENAG